MRYFPLKTAIFLIFVMPILFALTLIGIEHHLNRVYQHNIESYIVTEYKTFINRDGSISDSPQDFIAKSAERSISKFEIKNGILKRFNPNIVVNVSDDKAKEIYWYYNINGIDKSSVNTGSVDMVKQLLPQHSNTSENRDIADIEIDVNTSVMIRDNIWIFGVILSMYMVFSFAIFFFFYRRALLKITKDHYKRKQEIESLINDEQEYISKLESLKKERELLIEKLKQVKSDYQEESRRASITEEELFGEIAQLESKLEENIALQNQKEEEIANLKSQLEKIERRKGGNKKRKSADLFQKRFANLYKNIEMNDRAIEGLLTLDDDDMQLKAEEVIHQLNDDPSAVTVKRKVFTGKKNRTASFEVLFAYNGRLYFSRS